MYEVLNCAIFIRININCCKFVTARHKYNLKKQLKVDRLTSFINVPLSSPPSGAALLFGFLNSVIYRFFFGSDDRSFGT